MGYTTEDNLTLVREYSDEEISNFPLRWVVPQPILEQSWDYSQLHPGILWVLPAELETEIFFKEQDA